MTLTPIQKFAYFTSNYPANFIQDAFEPRGQNLIEHLETKFQTCYDKHGAQGVILAFYHQLDRGNQELLEHYITVKPIF